MQMQSARWQHPYTQYIGFTFVQWEEVERPSADTDTAYGFVDWGLKLSLWNFCLPLLAVGVITQEYTDIPQCQENNLCR